jgi:Alkylmercury lyase
MSLADDVRVEIYRTFTEKGRAPTSEEIAAALEVSVDEAESATRELADQRVIAFHPGTTRVWLAHPFCDGDAPFEVRSGDRRWAGICIWDSIGILALLGIDGEVTTDCPDCGEPIELSVSQGKLEGDAGLVIHYGVPASRWYEDVAYT